jgi:hypothetical protein
MDEYQDPQERIHELRVKAREAVDAAEATARKWEEGAATRVRTNGGSTTGSFSGATAWR